MQLTRFRPHHTAEENRRSRRLEKKAFSDARGATPGRCPATNQPTPTGTTDARARTAGHAQRASSHHNWLPHASPFLTFTPPPPLSSPNLCSALRSFRARSPIRSANGLLREGATRRREGLPAAGPRREGRSRLCCDGGGEGGQRRLDDGGRRAEDCAGDGRGRVHRQPRRAAAPARGLPRRRRRQPPQLHRPRRAPRRRARGGPRSQPLLPQGQSLPLDGSPRFQAMWLLNAAPLDFLDSRSSRRDVRLPPLFPSQEKKINYKMIAWLADYA
jgi:hypothetical protein